MSLFPNLI